MAHALRLELARQPDEVPLAQQAAQLFERARSEDPSVVHDGEPIAELLRFLHVVRGVEHAGPGIRLFAHHVEEPHPALRVHSDRRLVEEKDARTVDDAAARS